MYEQADTLVHFSEVLQAQPLLSAEVLKPHPTCSLFVAWNGVLALVYEEFPSSLALAKDRLNMSMPDKSENFGSKWPKTTLGALNDSIEGFTLDKISKLRDLCRKYLKEIASANIRLQIGTLSVVQYDSRGLERLNERVDIALDREPEEASFVEEKQKNIVNSVVEEWDDLLDYLPKVNAAGSRISSYRDQSPSGSTCVAFLGPLPEELCSQLDLF
mmetsp:Transcript_23062/g.34944  ORF Transcript_23062/g.34944 Transcript_23062/m.34944 type:complete len:216 (-) Transcript_23062:144-791(-)